MSQYDRFMRNNEPEPWHLILIQWVLVLLILAELFAIGAELTVILGGPTP